MLAVTNSVYEQTAAIGPFYAIGLFIIAYYVVLFKLYRGPKTWKAVMPILFLAFGHLMHAGSTLPNFLPTVMDALFHGFITFPWSAR